MACQWMGYNAVTTRCFGQNAVASLFNRKYCFSGQLWQARFG